MSRQTWTAVVAAVAFGICAAVLALIPVPYVVWAPGSTTDLLAQGQSSPVVVTGATTFPTRGRLLLSTVSESAPDARISLLEALYGYWAADRSVLPRSAVYPAGATADSVRGDRLQQAETAKADAVAAALQAAKLPIRRVPVVLSVSDTGPSAGRLRVGDIIEAVDGQTVVTELEVGQHIAQHKAGEAVHLSIVRDKQALDVYVTAIPSTSDPNVARIGAQFGLGYSYDTQVTFNLDQDLGGSSAGLMLSLGVFAKLSSDPLIGDRIVAGTGQVDGSGAVMPVSAVRQRVLAAERAGASVFLIPRDNCADLGEVPTSVRLIRVSTVAGAISSLNDLSDPAKESSVKGCS